MVPAFIAVRRDRINQKNPDAMMCLIRHMRIPHGSCLREAAVRDTLVGWANWEQSLGFTSWLVGTELAIHTKAPTESTMCKTLHFIGPLPPPVHGQASVTERLKQVFSTRFTLIVTDTGVRGPVQKLAVHAVAAWRALFGARGPIYISLNSNAGIWLSAIIVLMATLRGRGVFLHYHAWNLLVRRSFAVKVIAAICGRHGCHIVLGSAMRSKLFASVPNASVLCLNNAGLVESAQPVKGRGSRRLVFGHLSNLTVEKGLLRAIAAADACVRAGLDAELVVAGPVADRQAIDALRKASEVLGERLHVLGPVYGVDKSRFFSKIHVFLFPSLYENEAEPLVLLEAMSYGVPCAAFSVGCIADDLDGGGGLVVNRNEDFSAAVANFIGMVDMESSRARASARFEDLLSLHHRQLESILQAIKNSH